MTDATIEQEIQAKGLNAPRITPSDIEANIVAEYSFTADKAVGEGVPIVEALKLITFCVLVLRNGHRIVGVNEGPVSPANFNAEIGRSLARDNAINQIWPLMGYQLKEQLYQRTQPATCPE